MVSKYFELKTSTNNFKNETESLLESLKDKQVILYGAGKGYEILDTQYNFKNRLNIVAIADRKFEEESIRESGLRQIPPRQIKQEEFDKILVTNEQPNSVMHYLLNALEIHENKIIRIFNEEIKEEALNVNYLYKNKFDKTLPKLIKKMKNKTVVLYGAGIYLRAILKYFDLSGLNIIGIADKKFFGHDEGETFEGYKALSIDEIKEVNPDYVIVATKYYIALVEELYNSILRGTGIKIKPLVTKSLKTLLSEIWL